MYKQAQQLNEFCDICDDVCQAPAEHHLKERLDKLEEIPYEYSIEDYESRGNRDFDKGWVSAIKAVKVELGVE